MAGRSSVMGTRAGKIIKTFFIKRVFPVKCFGSEAHVREESRA